MPASLLEDMRVLGVKHLFEVLELCFPSSTREYRLYKTYGLAESQHVAPRQPLKIKQLALLII